MSAPDSIARARLTVGCGPMARPLVGRLLMSIGAETDLPVDRVQEAALVAEMLVELCSDVSSDGTIELAVRADERRLELRVGPLAPGGAQRLLRADAAGAVGGVVRALASRTVVKPGRAGTEVLVLTVLAHPALDAPSSM